jgi:ATP-dependent Clp protease ATP-binding subunit ClpC
MQGYDFTETVRRSLADAREEASALKHDYVSPKHLLLGLTKSPDRTLLEIWLGLDIDPADIRRATLASLPTGQTERTDADLPYTTGAKRVLEFAMREASALKDDSVEPTHILLGLARLGDDSIADILRKQGATIDRIRAVLADLRGRPLSEVAVVSIEVKIQLRDGAVIQKTFSGGDSSIVSFLSGYLLPS